MSGGSANGGKGGLIRYPEVRAVEDAAFRLGLIPTRACRLLLPAWSVEVQATICDSEPYDLIDRYLEAAIAHGDLGSEADLAAFYGLDQAVVSNAVRFLRSIGHLPRDVGERLTLSDIGLMSVREGRRYTRELEDRRTLYFDGMLRRPLTRAYYDDRVVTFLDTAGLARVLAETGAGTGGPVPRSAFIPVTLMPPRMPGPESLTALTAMPPAERDRYNLPEQVISPSLAAAPVPVYLPTYVVRVIDGAGAVAYLAYTQASQEPDPEWSQACASTEEVAALIENEYQSGRNDSERDAARRWADKRFTGRVAVDWQDGLLTATFPASAFAGDGSSAGGLATREVGSFIRMDGWYFRIWCDDERLRRHALLDLTDSYLAARARIDPEAAARQLAKFGRQVGLGPQSPADIAKLARSANRKPLTTQLDKLANP
jgi:hypothetical protein